jgi:hypothetical protein
MKLSTRLNGPRRKQQHWLNKEKMRKQCAATARAAEGADPAAGAQNPGECALISWVLLLV